MLTFLIVLVIVAAVLLILVVLAQNPKGGGLSSQFGGSGTSQLMGVKRTGDFLEKTTWALSIVIVAICMTSFIFIPKQQGDQGLTTPGMEKAADQPIMNNTPQNNADPLGIEQQDQESTDNLEDALQGQDTDEEQ